MEDEFWQTVLETVCNARMDRWRVIVLSDRMHLPFEFERLRDVSDDQMMELVEVYTQIDIADMANSSPQAVWQRIKAIKVKNGTAVPSKRAKTKRTRAEMDAIADAIQRLLAEGLKPRHIRERLKLDRATYGYFRAKRNGQV